MRLSSIATKSAIPILYWKNKNNPKYIKYANNIFY